MDKEFKNMKLKLSLLSVFLISLIIFIAGASFLSYKYYSGYKSSLNKIKTYEKTVSALSFSGIKDLKTDVSYKALFSNFFILLDDKGSVIYNNSPLLDKKELNELLGGLKHERIYEDDSYLMHIYKLSNNYKLITLFFILYPQEQLLYDLLKYFVAILVLSICLYYAISKFIGYLLKPIVENFNSMKYFVQVAGHELKTPLAVISSSIQLLKQTKKYDEEVVDEIVGEVDKSDKLVNGLFDLYNINNLSIKEEVNVSEVVYEVLKDLNEKIKGKNIKVKIDFQDEISLNTNRYYIYILISNIISNAIKYNKENGSIDIIVNKTSLKISDSGIGISTENQGKIFDIFYRVSKHRNIEGFGLGLAIVKRIADTYNWKIEVVSNEGVGSEIEIKF